MDDGSTPLQIKGENAIKVTGQWDQVIVKGTFNNSYAVYGMQDQNNAWVGTLSYNLAYNRLGINNYRPSGNITFDIAGSTKISVNTDRTTISNVLNLSASAPPASSVDPTGANGDLKRDADGNLYLKANGQWFKFSGIT
ncbi:MAG: hypothetical protein EOP48_22380, partial [Sphingobacteriales bacterium]